MTIHDMLVDLKHEFISVHNRDDNTRHTGWFKHEFIPVENKDDNTRHPCWFKHEFSPVQNKDAVKTS